MAWCEPLNRRCFSSAARLSRRRHASAETERPHRGRFDHRGISPVSCRRVRCTQIDGDRKKLDGRGGPGCITVPFRRPRWKFQCCDVGALSSPACGQHHPAHRPESELHRESTSERLRALLAARRDLTQHQRGLGNDDDMGTWRTEKPTTILTFVDPADAAGVRGEST